MGFLSPAAKVVGRAAAAAMLPPPPPDITRWAVENIEFDARSPMPGPFDIERFAFLREIHAALSPEHPSREVTVRGSAQWGKTVGIIQPVLGAWFAYAALDALVVHPTQSAATEWVDNKWLPMRRQARDLLRLFGDGRGGDNKDAKFNQETLARDGSLKVASAGSPADLTGTTRRLVIMDDLAKFEMTGMGDPESLAVSRASGFEDAKILRVSTPMIKGTCRISRAYERSDQRLYFVPCPHCGTKAPLTWENFRQRIDPERLHAAHFACDSCGGVIEHAHKEAMVRAGEWRAQNPRGDHPGFFLWRAYAPQRDWASIAVEYAQVMGWRTLSLTSATEEAVRKTVEAETEQTFWNDVLGLPYEQASAGPDWEALRNRAEDEEAKSLPRGVLPAIGLVLTAGVDCQQDRIEVHIVAFAQNYVRWVVDYIVIPHSISDQAGRDALDALTRATWRTTLGLRVALDMMAIDEGNWTEDVKSWAKRHPYSRVITVKGASTDSGPLYVPINEPTRTPGKMKPSKQRWRVNVSQMKADFYGWLHKLDPLERGHIRFARELGDEYYRMVTAEVRILNRARSGVVTSAWKLAEPGRRNEALDTMIYAEVAARRKKWAAMTEEDWARLGDERGIAPPEAQAELFDALVPVVGETAPVAAQSPKAKKERARPQTATGSDWIKPTGGEWL